MARLAPRPIASAEPRGDPLRQTLASAINALREVKDRSLSARAAAKRAVENIEAAKARLDAANDALRDAQQHRALVLINAAKADTAAPSDETLRAARSEAEIAADDVQAAENAARALNDACTDIDADLQRAEREVSDAADAILAERAPSILAEAEALARSLSTKLSQLQFLADVLDRCGSARRLRVISAADDTGQAVAALNAEPKDRIAKAIDRFISAHFPPNPEDYRIDARLDDLRRAREALLRDAETPLP